MIPDIVAERNTRLAAETERNAARAERKYYKARADLATDALAAKDAEIARLKDALTWAVSGPMIETGRALGRPQDVLADELAAWINSRPSHYDDTVSLARAMKEDTP